MPEAVLNQFNIHKFTSAINDNKFPTIKMKHIIITILVLFTATAFAQKDTIRGEQFELTGSIINTVSLPPHCGAVAWGTVVEFKVMKFSDLKYKSDTIAVIFTCPEFYKDNFFQVGQNYRMTVSNENQADFGWSIPNRSILENYHLNSELWVISAEKIK